MQHLLRASFYARLGGRAGEETAQETDMLVNEMGQTANYKQIY
jgi:hypothetical protein